MNFRASIITAYASIEIICITWFLIEFIIRFISCPSKLKFIKSFLNWIDFASIIPYFVWLLLSDISLVPTAKNILRMLKILLVFKVTRFSSSLKIFGQLIVTSSKELGILFIYLTIGIVFFSTILFYCEKDINGRFSSIPAAFW